MLVWYLYTTLLYTIYIHILGEAGFLSSTVAPPPEVLLRQFRLSFGPRVPELPVGRGVSRDLKGHINTGILHLGLRPKTRGIPGAMV